MKSNQGLRMFRNRILAVVAALLLAPITAYARTAAFEFGTRDGLFSVSAELTLSDTRNALNGYDVTAISGTVAGPKGGTIVGLSTSRAQPYDDTFYSAGPAFDSAGLLFSAGRYDYRIFSFFNGLSWIYDLSTNNPKGSVIPGQVGSLVVAAPETATWAMLGLGFLGLFIMGRARPRGDRLAPLA
jgi:hypothetical protein